ncbi:MAG: adenylate/guanylate cyclase domain-containing protein, partial [Anaerolineales bacterium]
MPQEGFKRKLTAILSADVEGYSRLMSEDEEATVRTITTYREVMTTLIHQHNGKVLDSPGDNLLAEFSSVVVAVQCAVAVQKEINARNTSLPENRKMKFRIGINLGDVIQEKDRIYGDGVNIAARLEALSHPGGICISGTVWDHVKNKLDLSYEYLGEQPVKNIPDPVRVYHVLIEPKYAGKIIPANVEKMAFPLPDKPSIAVLPFVNMSGDLEQEYIADGITENIISALSKISEMFVIARNSTFIYKGCPVKVQKVAEELGVRYVLEGSTQKSGNRVRVSAQLVDAIKGHHLWAEQYDSDINDFFDLLDEITKEIITALQVELTDGEQAGIYARGTDNLEAYLKTMKANWLFSQATKDGVLKARQLAEEATALDPNYAFAYKVLGASHGMAMQLGLS